MFRPDWEKAENESDGLLRQGLRGLPVPETSVDFDARVHAALRLRTPWWRTFWTQASPVLVTAACSLLITLAILKGLSSAPAAVFQPGSPTIAVHRDSERMTAMENGDLSGASLNGFASLHRPFWVK